MKIGAAFQRLLLGGLLSLPTLTAWAQTIDLDGGSNAPPGGTTPGSGGTGSPASAGGSQWDQFVAALHTLWLWLLAHWISFVVSLVVLYVLACLLSWLIGYVRSIRPLAAPRWGMLVAFVFWVVVGIVLWPLLGWPGGFLPALAVLAGLHWGLWLVLGIFFLGIVVGLMAGALTKGRA